MPELSLTVPEGVTFEQAIDLTRSLLDQIESGISEPVVQQTIADLVKTENGARGFFVTYLTDPRSIADYPAVSVVEALKSSPDVVSDLLVKNLAMSSASIVFHRRNQNEAMAQGSDQVRSRTLLLIQQLQLPLVCELAQKLHESATTGQGEYQPFLDRWKYDAEQREMIQRMMETVIKGCG